MKEQIQQLIAEGRTEEALALLAQHSSDAILLQARFNAGKKQYNMGLIEFSEWQRTQAQINYAALELASSVEKKGPATTGSTPSSSQGSASQAATAAASKPAVFMSYNHNDGRDMRAIKGELVDNGIQVFVDYSDMGAGDDIQSFIDRAFKENNFIISLISENSLLSGWVNKELSAAMLLNRLSSKWIPVALDKSCFDSEFYDRAMDSIDAEVERLRNLMKQALEKDRDTSPYEDDLKRQRDLKANLGTTLETLKKVLVVDISDIKLFDSGIAQIVKAIKGAS